MARAAVFAYCLLSLSSVCPFVATNTIPTTTQAAKKTKAAPRIIRILFPGFINTPLSGSAKKLLTIEQSRTEVRYNGETRQPRRLPRTASHFHLVFRIKLLHAIGAKAVRERGVGLFLDVRSDLFPVTFVIANLFARRANRQQAAQRLHPRQRFGEFLDEFQPFPFLFFALGNIARRARCSNPLSRGVLDGRHDK